MDNEPLWRSFGIVADWIRFADTKAAAVLTADSVLLGLLAVHTTKASLSDAPASGILALLALAAASVSFVISLVVVMPRLAEPKASTSLLYFDHVAARFPDGSAEFAEQYRSLAADPDAFARALAEQVWANSRVARRKYLRLAWSIRFLLGGAVLAGLSTLIGRLGG